jgi:hypothetical protein
MLWQAKKVGWLQEGGENCGNAHCLAAQTIFLLYLVVAAEFQEELPALGQRQPKVKRAQHQQFDHILGRHDPPPVCDGEGTSSSWGCYSCYRPETLWA